MAKFKITVVGAGMVGGTLAQRLAERNFADIVLIDIVGDLACGKALDIAQTAPIYGYDINIIGGDNWELTKDSDIVVITSGVPRKPGMTREELLEINFKIVKDVSEKTKRYCPNSVVIVVSNPLDAMTYTAYKVLGFPKNRVMGMAGVLDTARFRTFLAQELQVSPKDIFAFVLGSHGDTMVPILSYTTVNGVPVEKILPKDKLERLVERTRKGGAEIVELLKTGSAYYAPSAAVLDMIDAIVFDRKRILPVCVICEGEYGINGVFVGVPVLMGKNGAEKIYEFQLKEEELSALRKSSEIVKKLQDEVDVLLKKYA
ncbi:MAG: malate dehydrogenase [Candidatus Calescibacterium sp.]|nr:malate dehydrogenase [Candidatus Calescibacterium sp.]MCX7733144.1 malate dehydrogenase [bacterium]MDW8087698.1 malate dehydrogenase [Candidatus Calescibacterium sp.]